MRLYSTALGIILSNDVQSWQYTYYAQPGSKPAPLSVQTAYFGGTANQKSILKHWVVTLYNPARGAVAIGYTAKCKDQDRQYETTGKIALTANDWDNQGYAFVRVQPKNQRALGSSLQIDIEESVAILDVSMIYEDATDATIAPAKSK